MSAPVPPSESAPTAKIHFFLEHISSELDGLFKGGPGEALKGQPEPGRASESEGRQPAPVALGRLVGAVGLVGWFGGWLVVNRFK